MVKKQCRNCKIGYLFVKSDWVKPSLICEDCRLREVHDIVGKLKSYISRGCQLRIDEKLSLTLKVKKILATKTHKHFDLISELLKDKEIRKLILQLDKESKIKPKRRNSKRGNYVHIRLLEGGSLGLGKKA